MQQYGSGATYNSASSTFNNITSNKISVKATDSRGYSKTVNYTLNLIEYIRLAVTTAMVERTESTADRAKITLKGNYFSGNFGATNNSLSVRYRYKEETGTFTSWNEVTATITENHFSYTQMLENLSHEKEYLFEFRIADKLKTIHVEVTLTKGIPVIRVGKNYVDVRGSLKQNGQAVIVDTEQWNEVTSFTNDWSNYGGTFATAAYKKLGNLVMLRGMLKGGTLQQSAFSLPSRI